MKVKDYTYQDFTPQDEKDFEVKTINDERLIDFAPGLDDEEEFEKSMHNFGDFEDLPDSDRETICRGKGISRQTCLYP